MCIEFWFKDGGEALIHELHYCVCIVMTPCVCARARERERVSESERMNMSASVRTGKGSVVKEVIFWWPGQWKRRV